MKNLVSKLQLTIAFACAVFAHASFGALQISTDALPNGTEMVAYNATLAASGGTSPYVWSNVTIAVSRQTSTWSDYAFVRDENYKRTDWTGDDNCWPLALPCAFPFGGENYTNVWVSSNGNIHFRNGADSSENPNNFISQEYKAEEGKFRNNRMLAVYWCDASADSEHPIYTYTSATRTVVCFELNDGSGNKICAAVELKADGTIVVAYGDEACNTKNCAVGLSLGTGQAKDCVYTNCTDSVLFGAQDIVYAVGQLPDGLSLDPATGVISGKPTAACNGSLTIRVTDGDAAFDEKRFPIVIAANANRPPVITAASGDNRLCDLSGALDFFVTAEDPEGAALTYKWLVDDVVQPGEVSSTFTYRSSGTDAGAHRLKVIVSDGVWEDVVFTEWTFSVVRNWYVNGATGDDSGNDGLSPAQPFKTIGRALDSAEAYDVIHVAAGVYSERLAIGTGKHYTIIGEGGAENTILVDPVDKEAVTIGNGERTTVFRGFTFTGGVRKTYRYSVWGGTYENCVLHHLKGEISGATFRNCTIAANEQSLSWVSTENCISYGNPLSSASGPDPRFVSILGNDFRLRPDSPYLAQVPRPGYYQEAPVTGLVVEVLAAVAGTAATGSGKCYAVVEAGANCTVTVTPSNPNRTFVGWFDETGHKVSSAADWTVENITSDLRLTARFTKLTFWVDVATGTDDASHGYAAESPLRTIQYAIDRADDGDTIKIAEGTYHECLDTVRDGKSLCIALEAVGARDATVIDGDGTNRCLIATYSSSQCTNTVVRGLTLEHGVAFNNSGKGEEFGSRGGGVYGGRLIDCRITHCVAKDSGGGLVFCVAERCEISHNVLTNYSGQAMGAGAFWSSLYDSLVISNVIDATCSSGYGAGVSYLCKVYNCTIIGNLNNAPEGYGGGLGGYNGDYAYNTILCENYKSGALDNAGEAYLTASIANRTAAELFRDASAGDFTLKPGCAAIDAGSNAYVRTEMDFAGRARIYNNIVDAGCFEYYPEVVLTLPVVSTVFVGDSVNLPITSTGGVGAKTVTWSAPAGTIAVNGDTSTFAVTGVRLGKDTSYYAASYEKYDLPFAFPFAGNSYTQVKMHANGTLSFGYSTVTSDSDWRHDFAYPVIVPYFYGSFQARPGEFPNEGFFVESQLGYVTFRWSVVSWIDGLYRPSAFSCTLRPDGTIVFKYGTISQHSAKIGCISGDGVNWTDLTPWALGDMTGRPDITLTSLALPTASGLSLTDGAISGTPSSRGNYFFNVRVADESGNADEKTVNLIVDSRYAIRYDKNSAAATGGPMSDQSATYFNATTLKPCAFALAGTDFLGWANTTTGAVVYSDGAQVSQLTDESAVTLYAVWKLVVPTAAVPGVNFGAAYDFQPEILGGNDSRTVSLELPFFAYRATTNSTSTFEGVRGDAIPGLDKDDAVVQVALPFAFRFYGTEYTNMWVSTDGYVCLGETGQHAGSYSEEMFRATPMIAVCWADAEPTTEHPVRMITEADSVTVVFDAEYRMCHPSSLTLHRSGRIVLKYGTSTDPTKEKACYVGMSAGDGVHFWEYRHTLNNELNEAGDRSYVLPEFAGLTVNPTTGRLTGTSVTTAVGDNPFTYVVTSADGQVVRKDYTLTVAGSAFDNWAFEQGLTGSDTAWNAKPVVWGGKWANAFIYTYGEGLAAEKDATPLMEIGFDANGKPVITTASPVPGHDLFLPSVRGSTAVDDWKASVELNRDGNVWSLKPGDSANFFRVQLSN